MRVANKLRRHLLLALDCAIIFAIIVNQISQSSSLVFADETHEQEHNQSEDDDTFYGLNSNHHNNHQPPKHDGPMPKDKLLFRGITSLTFLRNRRTTSKLTHSIPQLTCVGGTAGCKIFTVNEVVCDNNGLDSHTNKPNWTCRADLGERVRLNVVEIICEGYEYPEDDYILQGSCGLEFTLDYSDPLDYHHHSYFKHMDEHEKKLHKDRVGAAERATGDEHVEKQPYHWANTYRRLLMTVVEKLSYYWLLLSIFLMLLACTIYAAKLFSKSSNKISKTSPNVKRQATLSSRMSSYGPLASAVLTSKKTC